MINETETETASAETETETASAETETETADTQVSAAVLPNQAAAESLLQRYPGLRCVAVLSAYGGAEKRMPLEDVILEASRWLDGGGDVYFEPAADIGDLAFVQAATMVLAYRVATDDRGTETGRQIAGATAIRLASVFLAAAACGAA